VPDEKRRRRRGQQAGRGRTRRSSGLAATEERSMSAAERSELVRGPHVNSDHRQRAYTKEGITERPGAHAAPAPLNTVWIARRPSVALPPHGTARRESRGGRPAPYRPATNPQQSRSGWTSTRSRSASLHRVRNNELLSPSPRASRRTGSARRRKRFGVAAAGSYDDVVGQLQLCGSRCIGGAHDPHHRVQSATHHRSGGVERS